MQSPTPALAPSMRESRSRFDARLSPLGAELPVFEQRRARSRRAAGEGRATAFGSREMIAARHGV